MPEYCSTVISTEPLVVTVTVVCATAEASIRWSVTGTAMISTVELVVTDDTKKVALTLWLAVTLVKV